MEVTFTRVPVRECEGLVRRDDGRVFVVPNPGSYRRMPPHDVGQFVVEQTLGWQTGFWGYVARGVVFPGMVQKGGKRAPHGDERSRAAIRAAKDLLAEAEALTGAVSALVGGDLDGDPDRVASLLADAWWPPASQARLLPFADVRRACRAWRQVMHDWPLLAFGEGLRFRWSYAGSAHAPENPLVGVAAGRRARR